MTISPTAPTGTAADRYAPIDRARMRELIGEPLGRVLTKKADHLGELEIRFIAHAPFMLFATHDRDGRTDCSPRGDAPGFVKVLDPHTLAVPDRFGNKLAESMENILVQPQVGLLFLVPGVRESLRVNGHAFVTDDLPLRRRMTADGKVPDVAAIVRIDESYLHCGKALIRSGLWDPVTQEYGAALGNARGVWALQAVAEGDAGAESVTQMNEQLYRDELY
ncbi:MSMEG_1061 family FMN-dependent PPOX-type flavoprotein [Pseudonocardia alni]|uniref:MSMEG_1061 family FMN-dependent PPOX-type flavoprotein n=1 Tax=Pseudonocardia alni TaxID=33907 RepID=UPI0033CB67A2